MIFYVDWSVFWKKSGKNTHSFIAATAQDLEAMCLSKRGGLNGAQRAHIEIYTDSKKEEAVTTFSFSNRDLDQLYISIDALKKLEEEASK